MASASLKQKMLSTFGVTVVIVYFIKILSGYRNRHVKTSLKQS